ncbi:hypothetical protein BDB00DRAFT_790089 [Zychaea mexicana]|uniref:uncharacterized protein n=1 Tax=Zychaea mexicana TaxID=64656 RepID=UPI0022FEE89F|nr:uncharacterized protein BDB00DRAFT_790089 [Zychaea mexicana]KAI9490695.1 hypothetical protein BDB00DRAFT_790089 [Zychaea mexicana]
MPSRASDVESFKEDLEDIKGTWNYLFTEAVKDFEIPIWNKQQPGWETFMQELFKVHASDVESSKEAFKKYLAVEQGAVTLKKFYQFDPEFVYSHSNLKDVKGTWNYLFTKAIKEFQVPKWTKQQPNWIEILEELIKRNEQVPATAAPSSPSATITSPSKTPHSQ